MERAQIHDGIDISGSWMRWVHSILFLFYFFFERSENLVSKRKYEGEVLRAVSPL